MEGGVFEGDPDGDLIGAIVVRPIVGVLVPGLFGRFAGFFEEGLVVPEARRSAGEFGGDVAEAFGEDELAHGGVALPEIYVLDEDLRVGRLGCAGREGFFFIDGTFDGIAEVFQIAAGDDVGQCDEAVAAIAGDLFGSQRIRRNHLIGHVAPIVQ